jgi:translation initiation factor IF-3
MMEGRMMSMIVSRAPGWEPPKKQAPGGKQKEKASPATEEQGSTPADQAELQESIPVTTETPQA